MRGAVDLGLSEFGHIDVVCAQAGIASFGSAVEMSRQTWQDMIDINLTGVWNSIQPVLPSMIERGRAGPSSSRAPATAWKGPPGNLAHYAASKHGVVGLMRELANELAAHSTRVNTVNTTFVATDMVQNGTIYKMFLPESPNPSREEFMALLTEMNSLPIPWVESMDISNAVLFLASDEARCVTGTTLLVDAGVAAK
jgi:NAD(P)-dependent dehydrogenase (short-subunit alcohol dehydrogenase family)